MFPFDTPISVGTDTFDTEKNGTALDLLGRKAFGERMSDLMGHGDQPLVVALDGPWGSGKSHFLKLWVGSHNQNAKRKARIVYFDAFEQDYLDDPLISLVAAISSSKKGSRKVKGARALATLKAMGLKLARPAARIGVGVMSSGLSELALSVVEMIAESLPPDWKQNGNANTFKAIASKTIEEANKEALAAIDTLWQREEGRIAAVDGFRKALADLAKAQPLILVIDELDRCRPDYALSLLEVVKHFFSEPGVRFVLGVNLEALGHSVRQRYGAGVDADLYLQKFVHLTCPIPRHPEGGKTDHWSDHFDRACGALNVPTSTSSSAKKLLERVALIRTISLRDAERLAARLSLLPLESAQDDSPEHAHILTVCVLGVIAPEAGRRAHRLQSNHGEVKKLLNLDRPHYEDVFLQSVYNVYDANDKIVGKAEDTEAKHIVPTVVIKGSEVVRSALDTFAPPPAR